MQAKIIELIIFMMFLVYWGFFSPSQVKPVTVIHKDGDDDDEDDAGGSRGKLHKQICIFYQGN